MNTSRSITGACGLVGLLALVVASQAWAGPDTQPTDPWRANHSHSAWEQIDQLQRIPLYTTQPERRWPHYTQHRNPFVRGAAALTLGRLGEAKHLPRIKRLLKDDAPLVRQCALWALIQVRDPAIKAPLIRVLREWEAIPRWVDLSEQITIPREVIVRRHSFDEPTAPATRRRWLSEIELDAWQPTKRRPPRAVNPDRWQIERRISLGRSQWDAGEAVAMRLHLRRPDEVACKDRYAPIATERGHWQYVGREGLIDDPRPAPDELVFNQHVTGRIPRPEADRGTPKSESRHVVPAGKELTLDLKLASKRDPALPGVYLFNNFGIAPMLVRVRRSGAIENQVPALIERIPNADTIKKLGRHRVRAAVPKLIEVFPKHTDDALGFDIVEALQQIADPRAAPVLLKHSRIVDWDWIGSTRKALEAIGPAADPLYRKRILNWREILEAGRDDPVRQLRLSIGLLGTRGGKAVRKARRAMLRWLTERNWKPDAFNDEFNHVGLASTLIATQARTSPKLAAEALWQMRAYPYWNGLVTNAVGNDHANAASVYRRLWRRTVEAPNEYAKQREALIEEILRVRPSLILAADTQLHDDAGRRRLLEFAPRWRWQHADRLKAAVDKLTPWARHHSDMAITLRLAALLIELERADEAAPLIERALKRIQAGKFADQSDAKPWWLRASAHNLRARVALLRGNVERAEASLRECLKHVKENHGDPLGSATVMRPDELVDAVGDFPRGRGLRFRIKRMDPGATRGELTNFGSQHFYAQSGRFVFYIGQKDRLYRWGPVTGTSKRVATLAMPIRKLAVVDPKRVFVLFHHNVGAVYELGASGAVWRRPVEASYLRYITASPEVITYADADGTLHGLAPDTGRQQWQQKTETVKLDGEPAGNIDHALQQTGDHVVLADPATAPIRHIRCLSADSGKRQWSKRLPVPMDHMAALREQVLAVDTDGRVIAVSLNDGATRWQHHWEKELDSPDEHTAFRLDPGGNTLYVALAGDLWSLAPENGKIKWHWPGAKRRIAEHPGYPGRVHLAATDEFVYLVTTPSIVRLTTQGKVVDQHPTPFDAEKDRWIGQAWAKDTRLFLRDLDKDHRWEVWAFSTDNAQDSEVSPSP